MVFASEPFLVLDVLHYLLKCELVTSVEVVVAAALRRHALHKGFLLALNVLGDDLVDEFTIDRILWGQSVQKYLLKLPFQAL